MQSDLSLCLVQFRCWCAWTTKECCAVFPVDICSTTTRVGISGTTAKSRQRKFVPSSHPGPFAVVVTSRKSQTKVGTLACFDLL